MIPQFCPYCGSELEVDETDNDRTTLICEDRENCEAVVFIGPAVNPVHLTAIEPTEK